MTRLVVGLVLLAALSRPALAQSIDAVEVKRLDQRRGQIVATDDKDLDPYGLAQQVAIVVTVTLPKDATGKVTIEARGARYSDEATGLHRAWKEKRVESVSGEKAHVLFLVAQNCHHEVTLQLRLDAGPRPVTKTVKTGFYCAE